MSNRARVKPPSNSSLGEAWDFSKYGVSVGFRILGYLEDHGTFVSKGINTSWGQKHVWL